MVFAGLQLPGSLLAVHVREPAQEEEEEGYTQERPSVKNWVGLDHMASLRYLRIERCQALVSFSPAFSAEQLRVLHISECNGLTQLQLDSKCLPHLQRLMVDHCKSMEFLLPGCTSLESVQQISISDCGKLKWLLNDVQFAPALQHLSIVNCRRLLSLSTKFTAEQLHIDSCGLTQLLDSKCLTRLQQLSVKNSYQLHSLLPGCTNLQSMRQLSISWCGGLKQLLSDVECATALQHLSIDNCFTMGSILGSVTGLPALQQLQIRGCKSLRACGEHVSSLDMLQTCSIDGCWALEAALPSASSLTSLQTLDIRSCDSLSRVLPSARSLPSLRCAELHFAATVDFLPSVAALTGLESLSLFHNHQLEDLFHDVSHLSGLTKLRVDTCDPLCRFLSGTGCPVSLQELIIHNTTQLQRLPDGISRLKELHSLILWGGRDRDLHTPDRNSSRPENLDALLAEASHLPSLRYLALKSFEHLEQPPEQLSSFTGLRHLALIGCKELAAWPSLERLNIVHLDISGCDSLPEWPDSVQLPQSIQELSIEECKGAPVTVATIAAMPGLKRLNIGGSYHLDKIFRGATLPASLQLRNSI